MRGVGGCSRILLGGMVIILLLLISASAGRCQRVLVVTTEQELPLQYNEPIYNGQFIITDLAAAGLPFDVVTYDRFVNMALGNHDVIFLSGHTAPTHVSCVAAKCQTALQEGRKVFINGDLPHLRFGTDGTVLEYNRFTFDLFNAVDGGKKTVNGPATVPALIEKDPEISAVSLSPTELNTFTFNTPPDLVVKYGQRNIGFLYPQGGAIDSWSDHPLHLLDYGKVANYLRSGSTPRIGFANDRMEGQHIVSIEIHMDLTSNIAAIDAVEDIALQHQIPMSPILVYSFLTPEAITRWNNVSPLLSIGSHSRTHQWDWPPQDIDYEVVTALADQMAVIPATVNYFNFSGQMNPTVAQMDYLFSTGIPFGARGGNGRVCELPSGGELFVQGIPIRKEWFRRLSQSTQTPFILSQTAPDDISLYLWGYNFDTEMRKCYDADVKYGLYTFNFIHDMPFDPDSTYEVGGVPLADLIRSSISYMVSQGSRFITTEDLVLRLLDFIKGQITSTANPDGSVTVTAMRPDSKINEVKVAFDGSTQPTASGSSVLSQHIVGNWLYVTLVPEITSTFTVQWGEPTPPPAPTVTAPLGYISNESIAEWAGDPGVAEYQYAVGTQPSGTDAQDWTSAGAATSAIMTSANLVQNLTYYVSVKARYSTGDWSQPGVSGALIADLTPPSTPVVTDDGDYTSDATSLHATWACADAESGVTEYQYAIGTSPGGTDVAGWTFAGTNSEVTHTGLTLSDGVTYYFTVKAENGADLWSEAGVSDGITLDASAPSTPIVTDDGEYTSSADSLHASWVSDDPQSGIVEYQYAIGTSAGADDVVGWATAGADSEVTRTGLLLTDGVTYYFAVKALNSAGIWSQVGMSDGITMDSTGPSVPVVTDDGAYTSAADSLHATWAAADAESGVAEYQYAIGTAPGDTDVVGWTRAGTSTEVTRTGLSLVDGITYYFAVKALNGAELWSEVGVSDGIIVDASAPIAPAVTDDGEYTTSADSLHASWTAGDSQSGIEEYQYAIGTSPNTTDVAGWTSTGTGTEVTHTGLSLADGVTYYFAVKALNGAGIWSEVGVSDGIMVDSSAPSTPVVIDDDAEQASATRLHAIWTCDDAESGVADYLYAIGTSAGDTDVLDWTATTETEITVTGLRLTPGQTYYLSVKARNGAGIWSDVGSSDGIAIQLRDKVSIGAARTSPDGRPVEISGGIVTMASLGEFYIEDPNRSAAVKVISADLVQAGDEVTVDGIVSTTPTERVVDDALVAVTGAGAIEPVFVVNSCVGGAAYGLLPGIDGDINMNSVGLLVTTSGRITWVEPDHIYIHDGANVNSPEGRTGIKVLLAEPGDYHEGEYVFVTGISALEMDGETLRRLVRTRTLADVVHIPD